MLVGEYRFGCVLLCAHNAPRDFGWICVNADLRGEPQHTYPIAELLFERILYWNDRSGSPTRTKRDARGLYGPQQCIYKC